MAMNGELLVRAKLVLARKEARAKRPKPEPEQYDKDRKMLDPFALWGWLQSRAGVTYHHLTKRRTPYTGKQLRKIRRRHGVGRPPEVKDWLKEAQNLILG